MRTSLTISSLLHAAVLLWGLITFSTRPLDASPTESLPVDIISMSEFTQITSGSKAAPKTEKPKALVEKIAEKKIVDSPVAKITEKPEITTDAAPPPEPVKQEPKPEPKPVKAEPKPEPKPEKKTEKAFADTQPKVDPIAEALKKDKTPEPKKDPKKDEPKKEEAKPTPPKKPEPPKQTAEKKPPEKRVDFNQIQALLDKRDPQRQAAAGDTINRTAGLGTPTGAAPTLSASEIDLLRNRIQQCWNPPAGVSDARDLVVLVRIQFNPDGSLQADPAILNRGASPLFQVAAESAVRAVRRCAPYSFMPRAKYETWKDIEINFDPREMFRG